MRDHDSMRARVNHNQSAEIWVDRFMKYKYEKVIELPLVDRISMSNLRLADKQEPKKQVNMRDLQFGVPYRNGYMKFHLIDKPIPTELDD